MTGTAIAYLRKSSAPSKRIHTVSFEVQEQEVRALAARHGDDVTTVLSDWGKSGARGGVMHRPDYQRLLRLVDAGDVRTIYSYSLSRLSRSLLDFADLLERCKAHSVRIRLVQEGEVNWSSATGKAFAQMAMVFAEFERELATERNAAAASERRDRGDHIGQAPYGWRVADGKLVEREDERVAPLVDAFRQAGSLAGAAKLLNASDVPTRRQGTKWNHSVVGDILRQQGPSDVREMLGRDRSRARAKALPGATFAGLLGCPCGGVLTPRKDDAAPTGVSGYYCSRAYREPHAKMHTAERPLVEWAKAEAALLRVPGDVVELAETATGQLHVLEAKRTRVLDSYMDGAITKQERDTRLEAIDADRSKLTVRAQAVRIPTIDWAWSAPALNAVLRALWTRIDLDEQLRPLRAEWLVPEWRA